jgi:hypothetical protein
MFLFLARKKKIGFTDISCHFIGLKGTEIFGPEKKPPLVSKHKS